MKDYKNKKIKASGLDLKQFIKEVIESNKRKELSPHNFFSLLDI